MIVVAIAFWIMAGNKLVEYSRANFLFQAASRTVLAADPETMEKLLKVKQSRQLIRSMLRSGYFLIPPLIASFGIVLLICLDLLAYITALFNPNNIYVKWIDAMEPLFVTIQSIFIPLFGLIPILKLEKKKVNNDSEFSPSLPS